MHPLDNAIWEALGTRHAALAETSGPARRFIPEVSPLAGIEAPSREGYEALAGLLADQETTALFLEEPYRDQAGWKLITSAPLLQMVCDDDADKSLAANSESQVRELTVADCDEMVKLAALTKPGPFSQRTRELGTFFGIHRKGKLAAMAGERLKIPGYTEVSAVCTHPEHTGNGYARILMTEVMRGIFQRGEIPFLHVRQDNLRAIELYERLGFQRRVVSYLAVLRKVAANT
jgi:predicted GNAT family acetyltransferase